jgi:hypothetical protein
MVTYGASPWSGNGTETAIIASWQADEVQSGCSAASIASVICR